MRDAETPLHGSVRAPVGLICLQVSRLCGEFAETVAITQRMLRIRVWQQPRPGTQNSRRYGADRTTRRERIGVRSGKGLVSDLTFRHASAVTHPYPSDWNTCCIELASECQTWHINQPATSMRAPLRLRTGLFGLAFRIAATGSRATGVVETLAAGCTLLPRVVCAPETSLKLSTSWVNFPA